MTSALVSTRFGKLELTVTDGEHVHAACPRGEWWAIRGVEYNVSAHLWKWRDGSIHLGQESKLEWERERDCFMTRQNTTNYRDMDKVSASAKNAAIEVAVNLWASKNKQAFTFAQFRDIEDEIIRKTAERNELSGKIKELEKEIADLRKQIK